MPEKVSTGGTKSFVYPKNHKSSLTENQKKEIEDAYNEFYERKRKEKKRKIAALIIFILAVIAITVGLIMN